MLGGLTSLLVLPFALLFTRGGAKKVGGWAGGLAGGHGVMLVLRAALGCHKCPAVLRNIIWSTLSTLLSPPCRRTCAYRLI